MAVKRPVPGEYAESITYRARELPVFCTEMGEMTFALPIP